MKNKASRSRKLLLLLSMLCIVICAVSVTSFTASADTVKLPGKTFTSGELYQLNQAITKPEGDDGSITFETEIFIPEAYRNDRGALISTYDGSSKNNFAFEMNTGRIRVFSFNDGPQVYLSKNITGTEYMGTDANPKFVKIAITVDTKNGNIVLYVNGERIESISNTSLKSDTYYPDHNPVICIGNDTRQGGLPFKGTMKNVAMYRGVRTAAQISADHKASFYDTTDANLLFALDGTGSDTRSMEDKSANHNHALNVNYSAPDDGNTFSASELFRLRNNITPDGPITFETEIYIPEAQRSKRTGVILSNYQGDANLDAWAFELGSSATNSAGKIRVYSRTKGDVLIDYDVTQHMGTDADPKYAKIAVTVDTTNGNIVLYVNGIKRATATNSHSGRAVNMYNTEKGRLWIGGDGRNGNDAYFKGKIRNVALYKGVRTEEEILLDYARSFYDTTDENLLFAHDLTSVRLGLIEDKSQNENHANSNKYDGRAFSSTDDPLHTVKDYTEAPLTYEALIYAPTGIDRTGVILGNYPGGNGNCINFEVYSGGKPSLFIYENGSLRMNEKFDYDVRQDKWVHLAISMENVDNKDTLFKCYVDGELVDSYTQTGYVYTLDMKQLQQIGQISIGRDVRDDKVFAGRIRNVAIHNKTLTADEIKNSYENGVNANKSSFIACYEMPNEYKDGLASTTIQDTSGNGYDMQPLFYEKNFTTKDYDYSFAVVGDTQFMVYQDAVYGTNYTDYIYNWIVNNYDAKKMKYVIGLGDIIDNGKWPSGASSKDDEWAYAKQLITSTLGKNNIPYSLIGGNHDYMRPYDSGFNATFGNETSLTKNITGYYQNTDIYNYYMNFEVEGTPYMLLALEYGANDDILAWANEIVAANSDRRVIVTTHGYMNFDGTTLDGNDHAAPRPAGSTDANTLKYNNGDDMWEKFVRKHANIAIVLSGHIDYNNVVMREDKGDHGNTVHQFLIDPQRMDRSYGFETGMVAMLYFRNGGKDVSVEYVSTYRTVNNNNKEVLFNTRNQFGFTIREATETEYGTIPEGQASAVDYPVVLFNSAKNGATTYIGAYQTVKAAATEAMKNTSGNYVILLRNDLTQSDGLYISNLTGSITLDLGGHTLTKAESTYLFECYYGGGAFDGGKLTVKNGYLVNKEWSSFFCYNYGASLSGDVDFDFEFDNVSFRSDYTAGTGKTVVLETWDNGKESKGAIYSNVVFNDCVFDYTGSATGEVMLSLTNGATRAIFNVSVNGGKIISDRTVNVKDFVKKDNSDTVCFGRSANGYTACTLAKDVDVSTEQFIATNGAKLSYSLGVVSNGQLVYTLGEDVNTEYGIIPYKYADVNVYPFVVFRDGKCVHASSYFGRDNEESALSRGKNNGTVILMRRDFVYKESQYNNLSHANTIVIDLGGFTFTSTDRVVFSTQKKTQNDSTITVKNGTFILGTHALMKLSTWDPSSVEDGGSVNNPPYKSGNGFSFIFEDISIELIKGATTSDVICFNKFDFYKYNPTMFCNLTFNNCTFDLTASEEANLTMFDFSDNHCTAKAYFNGGTIKANSLKFLDSTNANEESFLVFGKAANGYTVLSIPESKIAAGSGDTYSTVDEIKFKKLSEGDGYVNYTLLPDVYENYKLKTNVTLYTNFVYNIYLPVDKVVAFTVSYGNTTISKNNAQVKDGYYHVALNIPAAETLVDVKVTAVLRNSGGFNVIANWSLGIFEYLNTILDGMYSDVSKTLVKDILIYSYTAHKYFGGYDSSVAAKLNEIEELIASHYRKLPTGDGQKYLVSNFKSATLSLDGTPAFRFYLASGCTADQCKFYFNRANGTKEMIPSERIVSGSDSEGNNYVEVRLPAYEMLTDILVNYNGTFVGAYNLYSYHRYVQNNRDLDNYFKLVAVVEGLMKYCASAKEYRDYMVGGEFGSMTIDAPEVIYSNSEGYDITPIFSNGSYYGRVTWTTNHPNVYVENGKIYAVGNFETMTTVTVTATTEHHIATKEVSVVNYNTSINLSLPASAIETSLKEALIDYDIGNSQKTVPFNGTTATFFLLVEEYFNPGENKAVAPRILEQLRSLISGGKEPDLELGFQWSLANCASMIALAKHTPTVWNELSDEEVEKLDFLMRLLTYASAFAMNDCNDYKTMLTMNGNFSKTWGPNYRFTSLVPMLAAGQYFGSAAAVDDVLLAFDYDVAVAKCDEYGFTNAKTNLVKAGKNLLENGGQAFSADGTKQYGTGLGVKHPFLYNGISLDEPHKILNSLLECNFNGGAVVSSVKNSSKEVVAYILDNKISPYEGMIGMYTEFNTADASGVRSSVGYSIADFNMSTVALTMMMTLGAYDVEEHMTQELQNKIWVGNNDIIFKAEEGYVGYANGKQDNLFKAYTNNGNYTLFSVLTAFWKEVLSENYIDRVGGAHLIGAQQGTLLIPAGGSAQDKLAYYTLNGLISGKVVSVITLSSSAGKIPDYFDYEHKHLDAPHPATIIFVYRNGALYTVDGSGKQLDKICDYNGSEITLAITYDTNGTQGEIYILENGEYKLAATYSYTNAEGTIGRLGYFYLPINKQNDVLTDHEVKFSATHYGIEEN